MGSELHRPASNKVSDIPCHVSDCCGPGPGTSMIRAVAFHVPPVALFLKTDCVLLPFIVIFCLV